MATAAGQYNLILLLLHLVALLACLSGVATHPLFLEVCCKNECLSMFYGRGVVTQKIYALSFPSPPSDLLPPPLPLEARSYCCYMPCITKNARIPFFRNPPPPPSFFIDGLLVARVLKCSRRRLKLKYAKEEEACSTTMYLDFFSLSRLSYFARQKCPFFWRRRGGEKPLLWMGPGHATTTNNLTSVRCKCREGGDEGELDNFAIWELSKLAK